MFRQHNEVNIGLNIFSFCRKCATEANNKSLLFLYHCYIFSLRFLFTLGTYISFIYVLYIMLNAHVNNKNNIIK